MLRVVSTSSLPIDLAGLVTATVGPAHVDVPEQWVGVERLDLSDADALVCLLLDRIDAGVIARAPKLRVIANCAVGYDNVDVAAATAAGIAVTNTPDVLTEATAEFTLALLFAAARRLPDGERLVRSGAWPGWRLDQLLGVDLAGKTLGIVGLGRIGRAVARRAEALGMRIAHSEPGAGLPVDELFAVADVVSLHCPLTPDTRHLVNAERLALMKPTAILVNTARGGCVDEGALMAGCSPPRSTCSRTSPRSTRRSSPRRVWSWRRTSDRLPPRPGPRWLSCVRTRWLRCCSGSAPRTSSTRAW